MHPMSINEIFEELAATPGKNDKLDILNRNKDNDLFKEVCRLALDPFTRFFTKKIPAYTTTNPGRVSLPTLLTCLKAISNREVTGNAAITELQNILCSASTDDAKVIERIVLKDLRCGVDTAVNKVWPNLVMDYPCMLATAFDAKLVDKFKFPALVQCKLDGMRFNAIVRDNKCEFRSRQGKPIDIADPTFAQLFIDLAEGQDFVFDGELLCRNADGTVMNRSTGNGIINKAAKGTMTLAEGQSVCAVLWDMIEGEKFRAGLSNVAYQDRLKVLNGRVAHNIPSQFRVEVVFTATVQNLDEAQEIFQRLLSEGQEGIIMKSPLMIWKNTRSKDQIKFKDELDCDLVCVGWVEGEGKYVGMLGKLQCESADGKIKVDVGIGDKNTKIMSDEFRANTKPEDVIGKIMAIKYNARIKDRKRPEYDSLFIPRLVEIREDKSVADVASKIK